jgi:hypothetical protein
VTLTIRPQPSRIISGTTAFATEAMCNLGDADVGIGQHRLGGLNVVVREFRRAASCAPNTPRRS